MRLLSRRKDGYREPVENTMTVKQEPNESRTSIGQIAFGLAIILLGVAMLTDQRDGWGIYLPDGWWPVFVMLFGVFRLIDPGTTGGRQRSRRFGAWLVSVGLWGLISELRLFGFDYSTSWPLLIIFAGAVIVWRALERPAPCRLPEN
jgi:hypothetical protein